MSLCAGTAVAQFSNTYFFGDSLTDNGSYKPVLPPGTGLFTTNPGPVWAQLIAEHYGFAAVPANQGSEVPSTTAPAGQGAAVPSDNSAAAPAAPASKPDASVPSVPAAPAK